MTVSLLAGCGTKSSSDSTESSTTRKKRLRMIFLKRPRLRKKDRAKKMQMLLKLQTKPMQMSSPLTKQVPFSIPVRNFPDCIM
jgi:hypothetical protein